MAVRVDACGKIGNISRSDSMYSCQIEMWGDQKLTNENRFLDVKESFLCQYYHFSNQRIPWLKLYKWPNDLWS